MKVPAIRGLGGFKLLHRGQSKAVFRKYFIEWSSFYSTVYHARKTAQDFEQVDNVVI